MGKRVVLGMSGGVDSSVSALILKEQGYEVVGLFMRNWQEKDDSGFCTAEEDFTDVRRVSATLDIPYYVVDFSKEYWDRVFALFVDEYSKGRVPNPDVLCNKEIKFDAFAKYAKSFGADYIATGHYCRHRKEGDQNLLLRAVDENKDQTYFLNQLKSEQLENVLFPIGNLDKGQVREIAAKAGLATAEKKDSTGICFIGERKFREFLSTYIPMKKGDILTRDGKKVGEHQGVYYYTIGQRRGLGIGGGGTGERWFVLEKDVKNNILYVSQGEEDELFSQGLYCNNFSFINEKFPDGKYEVEARIRHRQPLQKAIMEIRGEKAHFVFEKKQRAVAEGQYVVPYIGEVCLGGGVIDKRED